MNISLINIYIQSVQEHQLPQCFSCLYFLFSEKFSICLVPEWSSHRCWDAGQPNRKGTKSPTLGSGCSVAPFHLSHHIPFHFRGALADWSECYYGMCCGTKEADIQKLSDLLERPAPPSLLPAVARFSLSTHDAPLLLYAAAALAIPPDPPSVRKRKTKQTK